MERIPFFNKFDQGWPISDLVSQYLHNANARNKRDLRVEDGKKQGPTRNNSDDDNDGEETSIRVASIVLRAYILFIIISLFQGSSDDEYKSTEEQRQPGKARPAKSQKQSAPCKFTSSPKKDGRKKGKG
jgi:hypothetical protein